MVKGFLLGVWDGIKVSAGIAAMGLAVVLQMAAIFYGLDHSGLGMTEGQMVGTAFISAVFITIVLALGIIRAVYDA